jgi:hypothetical protein
LEFWGLVTILAFNTNIITIFVFLYFTLFGHNSQLVHWWLLVHTGPDQGASDQLFSILASVTLVHKSQISHVLEKKNRVLPSTLSKVVSLLSHILYINSLVCPSVGPTRHSLRDNRTKTGTATAVRSGNLQADVSAAS